MDFLANPVVTFFNEDNLMWYLSDVCYYYWLYGKNKSPRSSRVGFKPWLSCWGWVIWRSWTLIINNGYNLLFTYSVIGIALRAFDSFIYLILTTTSIYRRKNWDSDMLSSMPKLIQVLSDGAGIQLKLDKLRSSYS